MNGIEKNKIRIVSQDERKKTSIGVYFFQENDKIEFISNNNESYFEDLNESPTFKIIPVVSHESFYPYNYKLKIFSWKVKSSAKNLVYEVYSVFK